MTRKNNKAIKKASRSAAKDLSLKEKIKKDSSFSWSKVIIAALAAVTVAIISSRLNSVVNSMLLVALLSIISALLNEAYRIFGVIASSSAKKVADPILTVITGDNEEDANGVTPTTSIQVTADGTSLHTSPIVVNKIEKVSSLDTGVIDESLSVEEKKILEENYWQLPDDRIIKASELDHAEAVHTAAIQVVKDALGINSSKDDSPKGFLDKLKAFIAARPGLLLILMSTIVAIIALFVSYTVANQLEPGNTYTTINKPIVELTKEDRQALIDEAVDSAVIEAVDAAVIKALENSNSQDSQIIENNKLTKEELENELIVFRETLVTYDNNAQLQTTEIEKLKKEIETLLLKVETLEEEKKREIEVVEPVL